MSELLRINDLDGFEQGNCATTDPEVMFPERGGSSKMAKVCAMCVVTEDCLTSAILEGDFKHGIRGGMSPRERRNMLKAWAKYLRRCYNRVNDKRETTMAKRLKEEGTK